MKWYQSEKRAVRFRANHLLEIKHTNHDFSFIPRINHELKLQYEQDRLMDSHSVIMHSEF